MNIVCGGREEKVCLCELGERGVDDIVGFFYIPRGGRGDSLPGGEPDMGMNVGYVVTATDMLWYV